MRSIRALLLLLFVPLPLAAQWRIGLELGSESISGVTRNRGPEVHTFGFSDPFWIGLRAESPGARVRWTAAVAFASPSIAFRAPELTLIDHESLVNVTAVHLAAVIPLVRLGPAVVLRGEAGPVIERWALEGEDTQIRASGEAGISFDVGLGGRFSAVMGGHLGLTPVSPFDGVELPDGLESRSAWRKALRGSVRFAL